MHTHTLDLSNLKTDGELVNHTPKELQLGCWDAELTAPQPRDRLLKAARARVWSRSIMKKSRARG